MEILSNPFAIFILQAILVVVTCRALGLLTTRLGQPMVIAEITAGIVLGPSVLGAIAPSVAVTVFPKGSLTTLGLVSQVGLLLFMFIIGLELHPKLLRGRARQAVAISHASIVLPFALGGVSAIYFYPTLAPPNVSFVSFLLFMGSSMSITAFPVLARILVERRLLRTRIGATALSCAAVDDVTAWCILAFVVSIVRSASLVGAVRTVAFALLYIGVMVWVVRPVLDRLASRTRITPSQSLVAMILVAVLASSWLTELIGIHALFGAFLLGAIIPKHGSLAAALTEKIEDVVVALLLPLFFAFSGLRTQIGLLDSPSAWLACGAIIVIACAGKFGGSAIAARLTGFSWREASAIGTLMNTRGLMELIVLNIGLDLGVISPRLFTMLVIMAVVTTFMTTPLLQLFYPFELFARELAEPTDAPAPAPRFTALACLSQEVSASNLMTLAVALAGRPSPDTRLYALRLVPAHERSSALLVPSDGEEDNELRADVVLGSAIARARALDTDVRPLSFISRMPAEDICGVADVKRAAIVLLGWHSGVARSGGAAAQSVIEDVMHKTTSDVVALVDRGLTTIRKVLVAFAGSDAEVAAMRLACRIALGTNASLTVLAVSARESGQALRQIEREARQELAAIADERLTIVSQVAPHPRTAVAAMSAEGYDIVVISVGAAWGIEEHSFALDPERVLQGIACSVVVVRQANPSSREVVISHVARISEDIAGRYGTLRPPAA